MEKVRAVIISHGRINNWDFYRQFIKPEDIVICADGGANHAFKLDLIPQLIIGDMDSISAEVMQFYSQKKVEIKRFSAEKNKTDTELALDYALALNEVDRVIVMAAVGDRVDHTWANVYLLSKGAPKGKSCAIVESNCRIYFVDKTLSLKGKPGDIVTILPFGSVAEGVTLEGFRYPLQKGKLIGASSLGVSNELIDQKAQINVNKGCLLVFVTPT